MVATLPRTCATGGERGSVIDWQSRETLSGDEISLRAYVNTLVNVTEFNYLCHILTATDDYKPLVTSNIRKPRKKWE